MKHYLRLLLLLIVCFLCVEGQAQTFRFALLSDLHIAVEDTTPTADLRAAVQEINTMDSVDFVLVTGDITERGDALSLRQAKVILDSLRAVYYITSGNHDTKWNTVCSADFLQVFGTNKFSFLHQNCHFIGFNTGPQPGIAQGFVIEKDLEWLAGELENLPPKQAVFVCTHYPLQQGDVENYNEIINLLRRYNVQAILGGHYHRNVLLNCGGICNVLHRSTLRGKKQSGGYTLIIVTPENILFQEKEIGVPPEQWLVLPFGERD